MRPWLGISWMLTSFSGWGVFGINLSLELLKRGRPLPLLLMRPGPLELPPSRRRAIDGLLARQEQLATVLERERAPDKVATLREATVLHSLGNQFVHSDLSDAVRGGRNVGVIFFEDTDLGEAALARGRSFDRVLAGSTWNRDVLRARGLDDARAVLQGVDLSLFRPAPRVGRYGDRFVVFSGGKLEYRKGQDIVLAAFRAFRARCPEALLVTAWQNLWPESAAGVLLGQHAQEAPAVGADGRLDVVGWAESFGIPRDAVVDLGYVPNHQMPDVLGEAHAAVFPNRCEGGTNLVAMEAMAAGVPVILSANTGHLDLIGGDNCFPLMDQRPIAGVAGIGTEGWGETSVDELVEAMEKVRRDPAEAVRRRSAGVRFMRSMGWPEQIGKLLEAVEDLD
jgi:glycosyltransferase involved in cell wall biosynthesis